MENNNYIYIENNFLNVYSSFALEYYLTTEKTFPDNTVFLIWRTTPTVMVGKFQNTYREINSRYVKENNIDVVRRMSGGGTIFTDLGGWQFSFIAPAKTESISFKEYTEPIIEVLKSLGIEAYFDGRNDIMVDGSKISGNAQYMKNGFRVHHGSLLYSTDLDMLERSTLSNEKKLRSKGVKSVREYVGNISDYFTQPLSITEFRDRIIKKFIKDKSQIVSLTRKDFQRIEEIAAEKFSDWENIYGKNPEFDIVRRERCRGGDVCCGLNVKQGRITEISITGNFFGNIEMNNIESALTGCPYEYDSVRQKLETALGSGTFINIDPEDIARIICS